MAPKNSYNSDIKDHYTDYHNEYNEKVWNTVRISKMWHSDTKWKNAAGKMPLIDLLNTGLPETFNL